VILAAVGVVAAVIAGWSRQRMRTRAWLSSTSRAVRGWRRAPLFSTGVVVWTLLILAVIGWDLNSFVHEVHYLPTLSYEIGRVTRYEWGRALLFAAWLAAGIGLVTASLLRGHSDGKPAGSRHGREGRLPEQQSERGGRGQ